MLLLKNVQFTPHQDYTKIWRSFSCTLHPQRSRDRFSSLNRCSSAKVIGRQTWNHSINLFQAHQLIRIMWASGHEKTVNIALFFCTTEKSVKHFHILVRFGTFVDWISECFLPVSIFGIVKKFFHHFFEFVSVNIVFVIDSVDNFESFFEHYLLRQGLMLSLVYKLKLNDNLHKFL